MLFLALQGVILQKYQNINFWKLVRAALHAISTCGPVQTSFQVDIQIYEDKLSQSGDRILSSHITIKFIDRWNSLVTHDIAKKKRITPYIDGWVIKQRH